jgi:hypothetical protein
VSDPDPVERYLDRLLGYLRGETTEVRRILAEVEEHLRDATAAGVAEGLDEREAQRRAVAAFGRPREVAGRFPRDRVAVPAGVVLAELARTGLALGAVALVAIGVSGGLADLLGRLFGPAFVSGDMPGVTYTPARCAQFLEYFPHAGSCNAAATLDHWGEVVEFRVFAGVVGLIVLGIAALARRGRPAPAWTGVLPKAFAPVVATALYAVAAALLLLASLQAALVAGGAGVGQWLSAAIVAVAMAAWYGTRLIRRLSLRAGRRDLRTGA